jgi:hypothetical protein
MVSSPGQSQLDLVAVCGDACDNIAGLSKCFSGVQSELVALRSITGGKRAATLRTGNGRNQTIRRKQE